MSNKKKIDLSIIVISYNNFFLLKKCIESIVKYTNKLAYEIIIVDNNSTEDGLDELGKGIENLTIIKNKENFGFAKANNQGIEIANGEYCLLLNNDTELISNTLKEAFDFLNKRSKTILGCQLLNTDGTNQESAVPFPSLINIFTESFFIYKFFPKNKLLNKYYLNYTNIIKPIEVDVIKGAFMFGETKLFKDAQGFDERFFFYSEETDLCYRLKNNFGVNIVLNPNLKVYHHNSESNFKSWFHHKHVSIGKIQYYQKHFKGLKKLWALFFHFCGNFLRIFLNAIFGIIKRDGKYFIKANSYLKLLFIFPKNRFNS